MSLPLVILAGFALTQSAYETLVPTPGLSIEVPKHWARLSREQIANSRAFSQALSDDQPMTKDTVLAMEATPGPSGAKIRLSVVQTGLTTDMLREATQSAMDDFGKEFETQQNSKKGMPVKISQVKVSKSKVDGKLAMCFRYTRSGLPSNPGAWTVNQYHIPSGSKCVILTLSNRQSDEYLWKPILSKVLGSLRITLD